MNTEFIQDRYDSTIYYKSSLIFMYSPAPLFIESSAPNGYKYTLAVTNDNTGATYEETREMYNRKVYFDLSQILQHLKSMDVTEVFDESREGLAAYDSFSIQVVSVGEKQHTYFNITAIYGALDQMEEFQNHRHRDIPTYRRFWRNFPQTFRVQKSEDDTFYVWLPWDRTLYIEGINTDNEFYEVSLEYELSHDAESQRQFYREIDAGRSVTVGLSASSYVDSGGQVGAQSEPEYIKLIPDLSPANSGTYLRWLKRDGSFGYWLFQNGDLTTTVSEDSSYHRTIIEDPAVPIYHGDFRAYDRNPARADYTESRKLSLGAVVTDAWEFDYLQDLSMSPVVDRLIEQRDGEMAWQRVNVVPGSYSRNYKRTTPHRSSFEIAITLPQRNTIKL